MIDDPHELDALSVAVITLAAAILRTKGTQVGPAIVEAADLYARALTHVQGAKAFRGDLP